MYANNPEQWEDFTDRGCNLSHEHTDKCFHEHDWPMYSYDGPSSSFWNGVANFLRDQFKLSDIQIGEVLMSKHSRWMLDGYGQDIDQLGYLMARLYFSKTQKPHI